MRHTKRFTVASSPRPAGLPANRRGVLLLVVLSMLTLFMLLGVTYLAAATRSRETAQAFARLTFRGDEVRVPAASLLDRVLMTVVRGGTSGRVPVSGPTVGTSGTATFESLLGDRYGAAGTLSGTATGFTALTVSGTATGVLSGTVSVGTNCRPTDLCGRILTFTEPGRPITSHRIIRAIRADGSLVNTPPTRSGWWSTPAGGRPPGRSRWRRRG